MILAVGSFLMSAGGDNAVFSNIGMPEILIMLAVALIVFGPSKLPELGRSIGKGIREFRQASKDIGDSLTAELDGDDEEE